MLFSVAGSFWPDFLANLTAGGVLAVGVYFLIERRLHLREQQERRDEFEHRQARAREAELEAERARRWGIVQDVLRTVVEELDHNADQADVLLAHLPEREVPYPAFGTNGWSLIVQWPVIQALQQRTLRRLINLYNRFRAANDYYAHVNDLLFGPSAILAVVAITSIPDADARREHEHQFETFRDEALRRLADRVTELQPHLDEARHLVREELDAPPAG